MAQPSVGTPIQLYYSTTASTAPSSSNLVLGELALNTTDGKLYYKTTGGVVTVLANAAVATGNLPGGSTGTVVYQSATGVTAYLAIGAANTVLTSTGTGPQYVSQASLSVGTAATATFATTASVSNNTNLGTSYTVATPSVTGTVLSWTGTGFSWVSAPAATSTTNIAGGLVNQVPFQSGIGTTTFNANFTFTAGTNTLSSTNITATTALSGNTVASTTTVTAGTSISATTSVTGATHIATGSITASSNTGAINYGTLSYSDTNIFASHQTSVNSYAQKIMQNTNSGSSASVDFIVSNDQGTSSTFYGDFGMNSSTYSGVGSFQQPNVVYLYSTSSDLVVGTQSNNYLRLVTNNNSADSITINPSSAVAFNGNYGTVGYLLTSAGTSGAPTWTNPATIGTSLGKLYFYGQF